MQRGSLIGVSIAVACVIILASFTNVVGVQTVESSNHTLVKDNPTPIALVFQLIRKLIKNKEIQNLMDDIDIKIDVVDLRKDISRIIERDDGLNSKVKALKDLDCGCDDATPTRWSFPTICMLLYPILWLSIGLYIVSNVEIFLTIMIIIGFILDCFWYHVFGPSQIFR